MKNLFVIISFYQKDLDFDNHDKAEPTYTRRVMPVYHNFVNWREEKVNYWSFMDLVEYKTYDSFLPQMTPTK